MINLFKFRNPYVYLIDKKIFQIKYLKLKFFFAFKFEEAR